MREGPEKGLGLIDGLLQRGELGGRNCAASWDGFRRLIPRAEF